MFQRDIITSHHASVLATQHDLMSKLEQQATLTNSGKHQFKLQQSRILKNATQVERDKPNILILQD